MPKHQPGAFSDVESSMGSTLHHLQEWCSQLIHQAMGEFREEQTRCLEQQCESLQAEQQRLARKHSEIMATADRLMAQKQSADDESASRDARLERRFCDADAWLGELAGELAREQAGNSRALQELRTEVSRGQGLPEEVANLKEELSATTSNIVENLLRSMGERLDSQFVELRRRLEGLEAAGAGSAEAQEAFHDETRRLRRQVLVAQEEFQIALSDSQNQWVAQFGNHQQEIARYIQTSDGMLERVHVCCLAFQEYLGKDRAKAEAALGQLVGAMGDIREYTGKYAAEAALQYSPVQTPTTMDVREARPLAATMVLPGGGGSTQFGGSPAGRSAGGLDCRQSRAAKPVGAAGGLQGLLGLATLTAQESRGHTQACGISPRWRSAA